MTVTGFGARVEDHCGNARIVPISRERAEGILALHADCDPACPRKVSAAAFLRGRTVGPSERQSDDR